MNHYEFELLKELAGISIRKHYDCDDGYYSCPLSYDGCLDDRVPKDICNCGATAHNIKVTELYKSLARSSLTPEQFKEVGSCEEGHP